MTNFVFPQFQEIQDVLFLKENKIKKALYYILGILLLAIPFYIFQKFKSLQILLYDVTEDITQADYLLLKYKKEQQFLDLSTKEVKLNPYQQNVVKTVCVYNHQIYYYNEKKKQFKSLGDRFPKYITEQQEQIFQEIKCLSLEEIQQLQNTYGKNVFKIPLPSFLYLLSQYMQQPLIFFFYILIVVNLFLGKYMYAFFNIFVLSYNFYFQHKVRVKEIKQANKLSQNPQKIKVFRKVDGKIEKIEILDTELVIGDIVEIFNKQIVQADVLILKGRAVVDESALTGENFPVLKNNYQKEKITTENVILSGSNILETQNHKVYALVMRISWDSFQGQFICSIGKKKENFFEIEVFLIKMYTVIFCISSFLFLVRLMFYIKYNMQIRIISEIFLVFQLIDVSFPLTSFVAIYFNEYLNTITLKNKEIQKLTSNFLLNSARVKQVCFDKTGTLTKQNTKFDKLIVCDSNNFYETFEDLNNLRNDESSQRIYEIFLCCNSLLKINNEIKGDPIEIEMFQKTKSDIETQIIEKEMEEQKHLKFLPRQKMKEVIKNVTINQYFKNKYQITEDHLKTLRTFQFDSEKKRMGVIIQNIFINKQKDYTYLCKGAPEKIIERCNQDTIPEDLNEQIKYYGKKGFRILAMSYTNIDDKDSEQNDCEKDMIFLGLIAFRNELKDNTKKHIKELSDNNFNICMITGDALETSISIGYKCEMIKKYEKVYIGKYNKTQNIIEWTDNNIQDHNQQKIEQSSLSSFLVNTQLQGSVTIENIQEFETILKNCETNDYVLAIEGTVFEKIIINLKDKKIKEKVLQYTKIYARCKPEQKRKIVEAYCKNLQKNMLQVAFVGDGANDSFALKEADIGLSIGQKFSSLSAYSCKKEDISKFKEITIEAKFSFECMKNFQIQLSCICIIQIFMILVLPFFYQNYGQFEYIFRFSSYIYMPFMFLLGSSNKISNILPSYKFNDQKSIYYFLSNITMIVFGIFLTFYFLINSKIYKYPKEILDITKIDYVDGDAQMFVEKKMIFFFFIYTKAYYRFLHRVGYPFGKGICLNLKHILLLFIEFILLAIFVGIFFLDDLLKNQNLQKFYIEQIRMPDYKLEQKLKLFILVIVLALVQLGSLWSFEKYYYTKKIKESLQYRNRKRNLKIIKNQLNQDCITFKIINQMLKKAVLTTGIVGFITGASKKNQIETNLENYSSVIENNKEEPLKELKSYEYAQFPWAKDYRAISLQKEWEFRKVKLKGILSNSTFLVAKERRGEQGYIVFKGFVTGYNGDGLNETPYRSTLVTRRGMMVNLGWIPVNKLHEFDKSIEDLEPYEINEEEFANKNVLFDKFSGFAHPSEDYDEDEDGYTSEQGYLRKGETKDMLMGKWFDKNKGQINFIDLYRMSGFFQFQNTDSVDYYLERAVDNLEDSKQFGIIPTCFTNPMKHLEDYEKNSNYKKMKTIRNVSPLLIGLGLFL